MFAKDYEQKLKSYIDFNVLKRSFVYSGGGSESSLVKINPNDLAKFNGGKLVDIIK